jgi:putative acyl-CoA dehydrogenase
VLAASASRCASPTRPSVRSRENQPNSQLLKGHRIDVDPITTPFMLSRALQRSLAPPGLRMLSSGLGLEALRPPSETYKVFNQSQPAEFNLFRDDVAVREAVRLFGGDWANGELLAYGEVAGSATAQMAARLANANKPVLHRYDRSGERIDVVEFHPAYHQCMKWGIEAGIPSLVWTRDPSLPGSHVARGALSMIDYQLEPGTSCPMTMTFAGVPAVMSTPEVAREWIPKLTARVYDPENKPISDKEGVTIGMSMTEVQGGSDVRANTTKATPLTGDDSPGSGWSLVGAKWFTSAPMCDGFLTLAQTPHGLSCFLVPRFLPDGRRNRGFQVNNLKNKLGDHANASSEVTYDNAFGQLIGPQGRGIATIIEMVVHTRLDCALGSAGLMRQSVREAVHHASHRKTFGRTLIDAPLMEAVLADMAVESEAAVFMSLYASSLFDRCRAEGADEDAQSLRRLVTAIAKYLICKRAPGLVVEALECHGGNGFDERWVMERHFRQSPLNSIWEGSGNVQALDILRTSAREPQVWKILFAELAKPSSGLSSGHKNLAESLKALAKLDVADKQQLPSLEAGARSIVEAVGTLIQAHVLRLSGNEDLYRMFCETRLHHGSPLGGANRSYGALGLPGSVTKGLAEKIVDRQLSEWEPI